MIRLEGLTGYYGLPIPGASRLIYCAPQTSETGKYRGGGRERINETYPTVSTAYAAATSGRNDCVILSPDSHSQAAALTWAKNMTHLIGAYGPAWTSHRSRIGHSADITPLLTVSGYGNTFANIYTMYGSGAAANVLGTSITGNRNSFINCHFGGPFHATEAATASFTLVSVDAAETTFKNCVFGADTIDSTTTTLVRLCDGSTRVWFDSCYFLLRATGANPTFIDTDDGGGNRHYFFRDCHFLNFGSSTMTLGIADAYTGVAATGPKYHFTDGCSFMGCTDVITTGRDEYTFVALSAATTTANAMGLVGSYELT